LFVLRKNILCFSHVNFDVFSPGPKKSGEENEKSNEMLFDQVKGIIPITSIAYLLDLLDQNQDLLAEMLKLVKLEGLGLSEEELMECDDVTSDAKSLIFRLGVVGLGLPKIQAPSVQIQVLAQQRDLPSLSSCRK
jgi:hypothetical protein